MPQKHSDLHSLFALAGSREHLACSSCPRRCSSCHIFAESCAIHHSYTAKTMIILRDPSVGDCKLDNFVCCNTEHHKKDPTARNLSRHLSNRKIQLDSIFLTNSVLCGSMESNTKPSSESIQACSQILLNQIEILRPKRIVAMGVTAVNGIHSILKLPLVDKLTTGLRQPNSASITVGPKVPILRTYHPASPQNQNDIQNDFIAFFGAT